jgi:hypothetical protein
MTRKRMKLGATATDPVIWGEEANVKYFFPTATPVVAGTASVVSVTRPAGRRRMYPGDPGIAFKSGQRQVLKSPGMSYGRTQPGRAFQLAMIDATGAILEKRQFTTNASVSKIWSALKTTQGTMPGAELVFYTQAGGVHRLTKTTSAPVTA